MFDSFIISVRSILSDASVALLVFLFLAVFIWGLQKGRRALIYLIFASFAAGILSLFFPFRLFGVEELPQVSQAAIRLGVFGVFLILVFWGLAGQLLSKKQKIKGKKRSLKSWLYLFWFNVVTTGLLASVALSLIPVSLFTNLNDFIIVIFGQPLSRFLWALLAAVSLFL